MTHDFKFHKGDKICYKDMPSDIRYIRYRMIGVDEEMPSYVVLDEDGETKVLSAVFVESYFVPAN